MSMESAKSFMKRMTNDEEFAAKILACKDANQRLLTAQAEGFDFTAEEVNRVRNELSDAELDMVAGGTGKEYKECNLSHEYTVHPEFVWEAGFDFTPEEIGQISAELSDTELDQAAGGSAPGCSEHFRYQDGRYPTFRT